MRARLLVAILVLAAFRAPAPVAHAEAPTRSAALSAALRESPGVTHKVWVYFRDKGPDPRLDATTLSPRASSASASKSRGSTP